MKRVKDIVAAVALYGLIGISVGMIAVFWLAALIFAATGHSIH